MKHESKQHGRSEQLDTTLLIPEPLVQYQAKKYGLGNYVDDIKQELRLALLEARDCRVDEPEKYAFGILRNILRKRYEGRRQEREFEKDLKDLLKPSYGDSRTACPADAVERKELLEQVLDIIKELPLRQRIVLNLKFHPEILDENKVTWKKIGEITMTCEATVRDDYRKALRSVKQRLNIDEVTKP